MAAIEKIITDLNGKNEKVIILALMHIPKLTEEQDKHKLKELLDIIQIHTTSTNSDIAYLSKKSLNWLTKKTGINYTPFQSQELSENEIEKLLVNFDAKADFKEISQYLEHKNLRIVASAIEAIARSAPIKDQEILLTPFLDSDDNRIRANAIIAIGTFSTDSIIFSLESMLNTTKIAMRESATYAMSHLPPSLEIKNLILRCLHDPYRDIRIRALKSLVNYSGNDVINQLKRLTNDIDIEICEIASELLEKLKDSKANDESIIDELFELPEPIIITQNKSTLDEDDEFIDESSESFLDVDESADSITLEDDFLVLKPEVNEIKKEEDTEIIDLFAFDDKASDLKETVEHFEELILEDEPDSLLELKPEADLDIESELSIELEPKLETTLEPEIEPVYIAPTINSSLVNKLILDKEKQEEDRLKALNSLANYLNNKKTILDSQEEVFTKQVKLPEITDEILFKNYFHLELSPYSAYWLEKVPDLKNKQKELELQANILLEETGKYIFQLAKIEPITNTLVKKALNQVINHQLNLKNYYETNTPKTREDFKAVRTMQLNIKTSFSNLAKVALHELRQNKFDFKDSNLYQNKLSNIVRELKKLTA